MMTLRRGKAITKSGTPANFLAMNDNIATTIEDLLDKAGDYSKTSIQLLKLKAIDKSAGIVSSLAAKTTVIIIVAMFILTASIAIALWAGEKLGKMYYGFLCVAGFYAISAILLYIFREQWIRQPVSNSMIKKLLQ